MKKSVKYILSLLMVTLMAFSVALPASAKGVCRADAVLCSTGSCNNAVSILRGYGCENPSQALNLYCNYCTDDSCSTLSEILKAYGCTDQNCKNILNALKCCGYRVPELDKKPQTDQPETPYQTPVPTNPYEAAPSQQPTQPASQQEVSAPTTAKDPTQSPLPSETTETEPTEAAASPFDEIFVVSDYEDEVIRLVNEIRSSYGLTPLERNDRLCQTARMKALDMAENSYFDHTSPTYGSPFDMMRSFGISYRTAGENIAFGYRTPASVVDGWMNSPGHRANILNRSFTEIGVGYVSRGNYWSQMFIG